MSASSGRPPQLEIAHVLYMDLVEYTRLPMAEQTRQLGQLQELLRATSEFRHAEATPDLICRPTGDGMALAFFRDPVAPVNCALELTRALTAYPHIRLRIGIHSGPVYRVEGIDGSKDLSGGGINIAQRVMDCGDAGHILLSSTMAELLVQVGDWSSLLHDLGECKVKHGDRVHLFNLYTDEVGNPALPAPLLAAPAAGRRPAAEPPHVPATAAPRRLERVALLYKRHAQPDEQVLHLLEEALTAQGHPIFVDRHLAIGVEWARAIEREIRTSDAVVPLLSAASVESEMLKEEVRIAHEAAQEQNGKPRLLPIRVAFDAPLEDPLAGALDPLNYFLWDSPADDERLVETVLEALRTPPPSPPVVAPARLEPAGGAVPLDSPFYVTRAADADFHAAIGRRDAIVLVKGARQMGKTSLLARGVQKAREAGARIVLTDFQKLNAAHLESAETLFLTLADAIADQLNLEVQPDDVWNQRRGPSVNFERYVRREVLGKIESPLVWGLDEVDRLFFCSFGSEVFGLFRAWHNERALDPSGPWSRLTLAIAYATEAHLFISDMNQSPFNVGTKVALEDFSFEQVADLNARHGVPLRSETELARFFRLVGGHPYLVHRGLQEMVSHGIDIATFEAQADRDEGIFGDHLRRILVLLVQDPELMDVVRGVLRRRPCPTSHAFYRLRASGLMAGESAQDCRPRCQLYANYLERHLR